MTIYENEEGQRVFEDGGWFYPEQYSEEMGEFVPFLDTDGFEVRFPREAQAREYLASK